MSDKRKARAKDLVLVGGPTEDGTGVNVLRAREESLELGTLHPLKHGQPIHGEVVKLTPRPEAPRLFEVETQVAGAERASLGGARAPGGRVRGEERSRLGPGARGEDDAAPRAAGDGPAMVATDAYRRNWDAIWSRPARPSRKLPN